MRRLKGWVPLGAIVLAGGGACVQAATLTVTDVGVPLPTTCTLAQAIHAANLANNPSNLPPEGATTVQPLSHSVAAGIGAGTCGAAGTGPNRIEFAHALDGATIDFADADNYWYGPNALPPVASDITIDGGPHGVTLNNTNAQRLRFFFVGADPSAEGMTPGYNTPGAGRLELRRLTLAGGIQRGGVGGTGGGGGAGMGGAIYNQGTLVLDGVTLHDNRAIGGAGHDGQGGGGAGGGGMAEDSEAWVGGGMGGPVPLGTGDEGEFGALPQPGAGGGLASGLAGAGGTAGNSGHGAGGGGAGGQVFTGGAGGGGGGGGGFLGGEGGVAGQVTAGGTGSGGDGGAFGSGGGAGFFNDGTTFAGGGGGGGGGVGGGGGFSNLAGGHGGGGGFGGGGGGINYNNGTGVAGEGGFGGGGGSSGAWNFGASPGGFGGGGGPANRMGAGGGAGLGGAIFNHAGLVRIVNSSFGGNAAVGGERGFPSNTPASADGHGYGGAIFNLNGFVQLSFSTMAGNRAEAGGAIYSLGYGAATVAGSNVAEVRIAASVMSGSIDHAEPPAAVTDIVADLPAVVGASGAWPNVGGSFVVAMGANSLVAQSTALGNAAPMPAFIVADPMLGPLQPNGGPTPTMAIDGESPARDVASCTDTQGAVVEADQRGVPRTQGSACDLGAFEFFDSINVLGVETGPGGSVSGDPAPIGGTGIADCSATGGSCEAMYGELDGPFVSVTLTQSTLPGFIFLGWGGDCASAGDAASAVVAMDASRSCTAVWEDDVLFRDGFDGD